MTNQQETPAASAPGVDQALLGALDWRCIGPPRGGRVVAVAGDPVDPMVFYFGACAGGVWKTYDGGAYWENISDGFLKTAAVGAIAVAESDPNVIYVGMGETAIRGNVSHGDGVYKSTDAGKTWTHLGLADTRHIAKIRVHPQNPDLVYVAALGHAFGPNRERGVYRSKDGGQSWEQVLFQSESAGAIDLSLDPRNPRTLYAAIWEAHRTPWSLSSGGPDSRIYRSTDGGDTWTDLTGNAGLPEGIKGKIGVAVSPARSGRVWAIIEAAQGGFFRSDDGGATWERVSDNRKLVQRPWYYCHVFADPQDPETVYVLNLDCWKSSDGGKTFAEITTPHGDNHELWIDPRDPRRMIEGNDGGACVSFNGGASWSTIYNQPTAQFYHVATDNQFPYRVYGTQQDNSSISVPSRSHKGAILWGDCYPVGSSESGHIAVDPRDPNIVYSGAIGSSPGGGGSLLRYDHRSGQVRIVTVWPEIYTGWGAKDLKYRFQWTFPICFSPHDPSVLYTTGNLAFRSTDEGTSWEPISPDLTRNDPSKGEPSGGPITKDTTGAEHYCTIFAFVESPHERGVFWAGSDDGLIHISRDGGKSWANVTPPGLPEWATVCTIEVSPHDPATAYVAATLYKLDDTRPYLFKTGDYGATWQEIGGGIPEHDFTRVIREDPARRGLLYAGTETGLYVSFDDGAAWQSFPAGAGQRLPAVPIYDLLIKDNDLVVATHGRSFWILDDLTPLHQLSDQVAQSAIHLFAPRPAYRVLPAMGADWFEGTPGSKNYSTALGVAATFVQAKKPTGEPLRIFLDAGKSAPDGVIVTYFLQEQPEAELTLTFLDAAGRTIKRFSSKTAEKTTAPVQAETSGMEEEPEEPSEDKEPRAPAAAGINRFTWNMRYQEGAKCTKGATIISGAPGPLVAPGTYQVQLQVGDQVFAQPFEIRKDPRSPATQAELDEQLALLLQIRDKLSETNQALNQSRHLRRQAREWARRVASQPETQSRWKAVSEAANALREKLAAFEAQLVEPRTADRSDWLHYPSRLAAKLAGLTSVVSSADAKPTRQSYEVFAELSGQIDGQLDRLREAIETDVPALNELVRSAGIPAIVPRD